MLYGSANATIATVDRHQIKPQITRGLPLMFTEPLHRHTPQTTYLAATQTGHCRRQSMRSPGLHFNKDQGRAVPQNQIDFATWSPVALLKTAVSAKLQKDPRRILTPLAEAMSLSHIRLPNREKDTLRKQSPCRCSIREQTVLI
jgi:hypothetical protein